MIVPGACFISKVGDGCSDPLTDPYWSDVVFLAHFDGASPTDEKGHTISGGSTSAVQSLFGGKSGLGPFTVPYSADFDIGLSDFTIEGATHYDGATSKTLFSTIDNSGDVWWPHRFFIEVNASGKLSARFYSVDALSYNTLTSTTSVPANSWFRWAITRTSGTVRLFLEGKAEDSLSLSAEHTNSGLSIGQAYPSSGVVTGYFDEVRITKACRYTADYTLACRAFPNS